MPDEAPEITAARIQAAGRITAALIVANGGESWITNLLGVEGVTFGTAAGEVYARVLRGMTDAEPTM
jgi:hypothetical protein